MTRSPAKQDPLRDPVKLQAFLGALFESQKLAVIATVQDKQPFTNLVVFSATKDLKHLLFATPRATRKFANLSKNPKVAMTIDNRRNLAADFSEATAVMAIGTAGEAPRAEKEQLLKLYLAKHPELKDFVSAPSCALIKVRVTKYDVVRRFQNVVEFPVPA